MVVTRRQDGTTGPHEAPPDPHAVGSTGYELLDAGDGRRLERFGDRVVDRPAPTATFARADAPAWTGADLRYERGTAWSHAPGGSLEPWLVRIDDLVLELRPTTSGQVGLFPDHLASLPWLRACVGVAGDRSGRAPEALDLFASTGLATLALASAGASVVHVDSARPTVRWARANADASGLAERSIRWIVDDAVAFVARELRRGRRYDLVILDPPTYGHGTAGRGRRLETDLVRLLEDIGGLLRPDGALLLTSHTPSLDGPRLGDLVGAALGGRRSIESGSLVLDARSGVRLELGAFARTTVGP